MTAPAKSADRRARHRLPGTQGEIAGAVDRQEVVPVTLHGLLVAAIESGTEPEAAAEEIMDSADRGLIAELALPTLRVMARKIARELTRSAEALARQSMTDGSDVAGAARKHLVEQKFALPDGTWVDWLFATAAQHLERARWMRAHAEASVRDAELHEKAAALIKKRRASCLAHVPDRAELEA